jgi:hypothetical protein
VYGLISDRRQQEQSDNDKRYDDDLLSRLMQAQESNTADHVGHNDVPSTSTSNEKMSDKQVRDEVILYSLPVTKLLQMRLHGHSTYFLNILMLKENFMMN